MTNTAVRSADSLRDSPSTSGSEHSAEPGRTQPVHEPLIDPQVSSELIATIAMALFSIAVAAGFARVFGGWQFLDGFIAMAVIGHGLSFVLRRFRVPGLLAVPILAAAMVWLIAFVHYRDSMTMLLPNGDTLELFQLEIERVREEFRTAVAPVIYGGGWDVLAAIGMALAIVLGDTFAFRAFARAEALVPGGVLFVFVAALGSDRDRVALTAGLIAAGVAATVALRAHHAPERRTVIGMRRSPARAIVPAAIGTALVVALAASFIGPRLPGADAAPIYETRGGSGGNVTNVVSPLVDIRSRLTNRSDAELFTVKADFESYWRLSALPRFDGATWGLPERSLSRVDGELSAARDGATELRQEITITSLGAKFVPAAADPRAASPQEGLRFNADSSTLLKTDGDLAAGDQFEIVSASPRFLVEDLQAATSTDAGDPIYLELPDGFPSSIGDIARSVTAGATTPYETALTLQNWFRSEFDYSLEVQAGHSNNAIEGFLRDRVGYCEQFAGSYAAMLRTLGVPARVAVGFTPGNFDGDVYSVLGKNAHAWPEVWFDGLGWVPFEPTPGRGSPGAENYTNVVPQQDSTGIDPNGAGANPGPSADSDQVISPQTTSAPLGDPAIPGGVDQTLSPEETGDVLANPTSTANEDPASGPRRSLIVVALIGLLLALPALIRRWRRRLQPADTAAAVAALWRRSVADVGEVGLRSRASLTPTELAAAAAAAFPVVARPFTSLAAAMTEVTYAPDAGGNLDEHGARRLTDCRQWSRQIERAVNDSISPVAKFRRYFTRLG
jgi:transglutaminase-like putative cysteine protease